MSLLCLLPGELESFILVQRRILKNSALAQQNNNSQQYLSLVMHLVNGEEIKVPVLSLGGGVEGEKATTERPEL